MYSAAQEGYFYETLIFIVVFTKTRSLTPLRTSLIQFTTRSLSLITTLILSFLSSKPPDLPTAARLRVLFFNIFTCLRKTLWTAKTATIHHRQNPLKTSLLRKWEIMDERQESLQVLPNPLTTPCWSYGLSHVKHTHTHRVIYQ